MISFKESKNIYLYSENIDMRMGRIEAQVHPMQMQRMNRQRPKELSS